MWSELIAVYEAAKKKRGMYVNLDIFDCKDIDCSDIVRILNGHFKGRLNSVDARRWNIRICRAIANRLQTVYRLERKRKEALREKGQVEVEPVDINTLFCCQRSTNMDKTTNVEKPEEVKEKVVGRPDAWVCICETSSKGKGWTKSTLAMSVGKGVLVLVSTQPYYGQIAEALTYVPGAYIKQDDEGHHFITVP
jgi:hypothetical protein